MKTLSSLIIFCAFVVAAGAFCLARPNAIVSTASTMLAPRDTIKFYAVSASSETRNGKTTYKVNGLPATKAEYDKYKQSYDQMANCKPCYMRTYSIGDTLLREGDYFTDCLVGYWKEYYPDGSVKVEGHFKSDETGKWNEKKSDKWCGIREGAWTYFGKGGAIDSVVNYVNNIRVR